MTVLLTGANGFLGRYIQAGLRDCTTVTLGLTECDYNVDLSHVVPIFQSSYTKVVHAAGLAHYVPTSEKSNQSFFDVNFVGTSNLLKGLEKLKQPPDSIIFISTVSVYGIEIGENIDEANPLNGDSPYACSKIQAEILLREWGKKNNVKILILRLPLVAGTNPPGNLGSMIRAIRKGYYLAIGDCSVRKSIVLAEDVARFVASCSGISGTYNLTDGYHPTVGELEKAISSKLNKKIHTLPGILIKVAAKIGDFIPIIPVNTPKYKKLTSPLTFSDEKARREIGWVSKPVIENIEL